MQQAQQIADPVPSQSHRAAENSARNWLRRRLRRIKRAHVMLAMATRLEPGASASKKRRGRCRKKGTRARLHHVPATDNFVRDFKYFLRLVEEGREAPTSANLDSRYYPDIVLSNRSLPKWERLPGELKVYCVIRAMAMDDPAKTHSFSINVAPARHVRQENVARFIHREIAKKARERLDRHVDFVMALHSRRRDAPDEPHAHGVAFVDVQEVERFKAALRVAGGKWRPVGHRGSRKQTHVVEHFGDGAWAHYMTAESTRVRRLMLRLGKNPQTVTMTRGAIHLGRSLYSHVTEAMRPFSKSEIEWLKGDTELIMGVKSTFDERFLLLELERSVVPML